MGFCSNALKWQPISELLPIGFINDEAGVLMAVLGLIYLLNSGVTIYWIYLQGKKARQGNSGAAKNVIFPAFVAFLWASCVTDVCVGLVVIFVNVDPLEHNSWMGASLFALSWALQHAVIEGIAFLLMQYGCGFRALLKASGYAALWGAITFMLQLFTYREPTNTLAVLLQLLWSNVMLVFYLALWLVPSKALFRRPAAVFYARFWVVFRLLALFAFMLRFVSQETRDAGGCIYVFGPLFVFSITKPYIVYLTLLRDSDWWQGLGIEDYDEEELRAPLMGVDIPLGNAQHLAESIDMLRHGVKKLNFAYVTLNHRQVLGEGSSSRVYKGSYRSRPCAVKLLFTLDLTPEIIRRCCTEATILSAVKHKNVVDIWGVCVLPPSVAIVLELCEYGSVSDLVRGKLQPDGSYNHVLPLSLSWEDKLYLALGCAEAVAVLHGVEGYLCHRDIKSFNFLVDAQLNAKVADLELGENQDARNPLYSSVRGFRKSVFNVRLSTRNSSDERAEGVLSNWMAPEVLGGTPYGQESDVYSLALVLYEIATGLVPFSDCASQEEVRKAVRAGRRPVLPPDIPEDYARIVVAAWDENPFARPSAQEIADDLFAIWQNTIHSVVKYVPHTVEPDVLLHFAGEVTHRASLMSFSKDGAPRPLPNQVEQAKVFADHWHMLEQDGRPFMIVTGYHPFRAVYCTLAWTRMTAYYASDIIGREFATFMGPFSDRKALKSMLRDMKDRSPTHAVLGFRRKDDSNFLAAIHAQPVYGEESENLNHLLSFDEFRVGRDRDSDSSVSSALSMFSRTASKSVARQAAEERVQPRYYVLLFSQLKDLRDES